jgi:hypothetical protein
MSKSEILLLIIAIFSGLRWWDSSPHTTKLVVKYGKIKYKIIRFIKKVK